MLRSRKQRAKTSQKADLQTSAETPTVKPIPYISSWLLLLSFGCSSGSGAALGLSIREYTNEKTRVSKHSEKSILKSLRGFHIFWPIWINCNNLKEKSFLKTANKMAFEAFLMQYIMDIIKRGNLSGLTLCYAAFPFTLAAALFTIWHQ